MVNEKIPHANWKFIERKSETFIPMAQTDAENSIYSHNNYQVLYHIFS